MTGPPVRARRPLSWLLVAEAISLTGSRISFVAVPWLVLETTGSAARTGLVAFAEMLPYVLASALGGPIVDRRGAWRISVRADVTSVAAVSLVPVLYGAGLLPLGALLAVIAVAGGLRGLSDIAKGAMFPSAVDDSGVELTRATALHDGIGRLSFLLGGAIGGVLIAWLGAANVLLIDAASFGVAAVLVGVAVRVGGTPVDTDEPYRASLRSGLLYVHQDRLLLWIVLIVLTTNLLDQAHLGVLIPVWVHDVVASPSALGWMLGAFGAGAVAGNVLFTALAPKLPRFASFSICFLLSGGPHILILAATRSLAAVTVTLFVSGVLCAAINPILAAVVYERVPSDLRARVIGLVRATAWAGVPVGGLLGGLLVDWVGLTTALVGIGTVYVAVTIVPFLVPVWRQMDISAPARHPIDAGAGQLVA